MRRLPFATTLPLLTILFALTLPSPAPAADRTPEELIVQGNGALDRRDPRSAIRSFEEAEKKTEGGSIEARLGLTRAYLALGAHKKAIEVAEDALALAEAAEIPEAKVAVNTYLGVAWSEAALGDRKPEESLRASEKALRAALAVEGPAKPPSLLLNLGIVLMRLEKDDEGKAALEQFLETEPSPGEAVRARSLIDDPRRARESRMPQVTMVTLDGDVVTEDDLEGKVVVLDFWTTWCGPCHASLPAVRDLAKLESKGDPVVVISVSGDNTEGLVRDYVREHSIDWTQVWDDRERVVHTAFQVNSYPTFVVVDADGKIVFRDSGWSEPLGQGLRRATQNAVKAVKKDQRRNE